MLGCLHHEGRAHEGASVTFCYLQGRGPRRAQSPRSAGFSFRPVSSNRDGAGVPPPTSSSRPKRERSETHNSEQADNSATTVSLLTRDIRSMLMHRFTTTVVPPQCHYSHKTYTEHAGAPVHHSQSPVLTVLALPTLPDLACRVIQSEWRDP